MRVPRLPARNAVLLEYDVPADGTSAANWRERRLRYVSALWTALVQATACLQSHYGRIRGKTQLVCLTFDGPADGLCDAVCIALSPLLRERAASCERLRATSREGVFAFICRFNPRPLRCLRQLATLSRKGRGKARERRGVCPI